MSQASCPTPSKNKPISLASANTGASVDSVISLGLVAGHAQIPLGRQSSEPRCDMPAKVKPPFPYASIGASRGKCRSAASTTLRPDGCRLRDLDAPGADAQVNQDRRRNEDRRISADQHDTENHGGGEAVDGMAAEEK